MITLYKGDDTGGQLGKNVKIVFHCDDAVDMDDVVVKFDLLGIVKREFTDVHDGDILDIFISHAESRKFPLGVIFAKMWGEDASGKLRTFANRIPFRVTLNLIAVYGSDGTDSQDIHVYSSVDWDSIANKPTVFPSSVEEVEGLQEALDDINGKIPEDASAENQLADKEWVDQEIDRVAAYYITSDAQGNPFQTRAALLNAETYYSGGSPRTPTRNDYAIVLADESHDDTEWRYIYSVNEQGVGTWEAQYPVEGAIVADDNVTKTSTNPVKSSGIWSALWGALTALPTGFTSLYDWCVSQLAGKVPTSRTVNGKALTGNVTLTADDVDALPAEHAAKGRYDLTNIGIDDLNLPIGTHVNGEIPILSGDVVAPDSSATSGKVADAEATYQALENKQDALTAQQLANIAAVPNKANDADVVHTTGGETIAGTKTFTSNIIVSTGNKLVAYGSSIFISGGATMGFPANSGTLALTADIPYALTTKTISNGAVTLDDRDMNAVAVSSSLASLTINFPTATSGKVRDFGLRLSVASGVTTAPELVLPQGVTCENADGEVPEIGADGAATILYFTETAAGVFLVKGEVVTAVS